MFDPPIKKSSFNSWLSISSLLWFIDTFGYLKELNLACWIVWVKKPFVYSKELLKGRILYILRSSDVMRESCLWKTVANKTRMSEFDIQKLFNHKFTELRFSCSQLLLTVGIPSLKSIVVNQDLYIKYWLWTLLHKRDFPLDIMTLWKILKIILCHEKISRNIFIKISCCYDYCI